MSKVTLEQRFETLGKIRERQHERFKKELDSHAKLLTAALKLLKAVTARKDLHFDETSEMTEELGRHVETVRSMTAEAAQDVEILQALEAPGDSK